MVPERHEVIVVDDDASMRLAISRLLAADGISACSFASAEEFLGSEAATTPVVLIVDIHLPAKSGFELQHELAAQGQSPPVIFITADGRPDILERATRAGNACLSKPFEGTELIEAIRRHLPSPDLS